MPGRHLWPLPDHPSALIHQHWSDSTFDRAVILLDLLRRIARSPISVSSRSSLTELTVSPADIDSLRRVTVIRSGIDLRWKPPHLTRALRLEGLL